MPEERPRVRGRGADIFFQEKEKSEATGIESPAGWAASADAEAGQAPVGPQEPPALADRPPPQSPPSEPVPSPVEGTGSGPRSRFLREVSLTVYAEIGRCRMPIKDILRTGPGSLIELDKFINEPIDLYANDRLVARGEVVVVGDHFGVRITELVEDFHPT